MKKLFSKKILFIALPLILVAGLVGVGFFVLPRTLQIKISTGSPAEGTPTAAAEDGHGGTGEAAKGEVPTLPYATRERVVNLADKGGYRYLKVEVVLEVALPHGKPGDKLPKGEAPPVRAAQFAPLTGAIGHSSRQNIDLLLDVELRLTAELGQARLTIREILELGAGSIVELNRLAGEPVDITVNNTLIAKGEVVVVDEKFGIRVLDVVSPAKRVASML